MERGIISGVVNVRAAWLALMKGPPFPAFGFLPWSARGALGSSQLWHDITRQPCLLPTARKHPRYATSLQGGFILFTVANIHCKTFHEFG